MEYRVLLVEEAEHDIAAIHRYVLTHDSRSAADQLVAELEGACAGLATMPLRGHVPRELSAIGIADYREIRWKPYRIIYQIDQSKVLVHCILDGRRDMQSLLQRRLLR